MPALDCIKDGKIFADNFTADTMGEAWLLVPNDINQISLSDQQGYLRINPGQELFILQTMPEGDFVLEVALDIMLQPDNEVGLCLYQNHQNTIKLSLICSAEDAYSTLRLTCVDNYIETYGLVGDVWEFIGITQVLIPAMVGFYVGAENTTPCDINNFNISAGRYITIANLPDNVLLRLYDENDNLLAEKVPINSEVSFDTFTLKTGASGKVGLVKDGIEIPIYTGELWGGSVYRYITTEGLYLTINNDPTYFGQEKYLGPMKQGYIEIPIRLHNPLDTDFNNILITPEKFQHYVGNDWVLLAADENNSPTQYNNQLVVPAIKSQDFVQFWLKVTRGELIQFITGDMCKFALSILPGQG